MNKKNMNFIIIKIEVPIDTNKSYFSLFYFLKFMVHWLRKVSWLEIFYDYTWQQYFVC